MALQKKFLHPKLDLLQLPKNRLITGVFIGGFYAINWYALLYLSREAIRILFSIYPNYNIAVFTEEEVNFYNLFFAAISVILGQSACIQFWLERPRRFCDKYYRRKVSILHEQKALNWIFMYVFSKVTALVSIFAATALWTTQIFSFNAEYRSVFILAIIVLYLNTWTSIRHLFKNASLKWMVFSILLLSPSAFLLSKVNLINYKEINHIILKNDISYNYNISLPQSDIYRQLQDKSLSCRLSIAFAKDNSGDVLFFDIREAIQLKDISTIFDDERSEVSPGLVDRIIIHAKIDRNIKMSVINDVNRKLIEGGFNRIGYAVHPSNSIYNLEKVFNYKIPNYPYHSYLEDTKSSEYKNCHFHKIKASVNNGYSIDHIFISQNELRPSLRKIILDKQPYVLEYYIDDNMTFDHYLQFRIAYKAALLDVWDEYALNEYLDEYYALPRELRQKIQREYPMSIFEITENMLSSIK